jgi:hypothetical protein
MVTRNGNTLPALAGHLFRRPGGCAGEVDGGLAFLDGSSGQVDGRPRFPQTKRNALADAAAGSSHTRNGAAKIRHKSFLSIATIR